MKKSAFVRSACVLLLTFLLLSMTALPVFADQQPVIAASQTETVKPTPIPAEPTATPIPDEIMREAIETAGNSLDVVIPWILVGMLVMCLPLIVVLLKMRSKHGRPF